MRIILLFLAAFTALAQIPNTFRVTGPVAPPATNSNFGATVPVYGTGGLLTGLSSLSQLQDLNRYPLARRHAGMKARLTNGAEYILDSTLTNWWNTGTANSLAELRTFEPGFGGTVNVLSYYGDNNGGGGEYAVTNTITGTNALGGRIVALGGAKSWQLNHQRELLASQFGATAGSGSKRTELQAAIDYATAFPGGCTVKLDRGVTEVNGNIVLKKGVFLEGASQGHYVEAVSFDPASPAYLGGYASCLFGIANINTNLVTWDIATGAVRGNTTTTWDGVTSSNAAFMWSGLRNLMLKRASTQTHYEPILYAENCWSISVERCSFDMAGPQFLAHFRNCNTLVFRENFSTTVGRGYLFDDCADIDVALNWTYGSIGPVYTFLASWKNTVLGNHAGNALTSAFIWTDRTPATVSGNTFTCTNHIFSTGSLVYISSTDTLPSPLVDTRPYWVIKLSANTFQVAASRPNAYSGIPVTLTTSGTGTITPSAGPACGMFFVGAGGNVGRTTVTANRVDQCFESSYEIWGWNSTTFTANYAVETSFNNATKFPAFHIDKSSTYNLFDATVTDTIASCSYIYDIGDNCNNNDFGQTRGTFSIAERLVSATGTSANRFAVTSPVDGSLIAGQSTTQTALSLIGNSGGVRVLTLERVGLGKIGLGVAANFWNFYNETANRPMASLSDSSGQIVYQLGGSASSSPRLGIIQGESATGTNIAGGGLYLLAGPGTGNSASSDIFFQVPQPNASGSSIQTSFGTRMQIDQHASPVTGDSAIWIYWWDGAAWIPARITVGGPGTGPGGSGRALFLP